MRRERIKKKSRKAGASTHSIKIENGWINNNNRSWHLLYALFIDPTLDLWFFRITQHTHTHNHIIYAGNITCQTTKTNYHDAQTTIKILLFLFCTLHIHSAPAQMASLEAGAFYRRTQHKKNRCLSVAKRHSHYALAHTPWHRWNNKYAAKSQRRKNNKPPSETMNNQQKKCCTSFRAV